MTKRKRYPKGNYQAAIMQAVESGQLALPPGKVTHVQVFHDDSCGILAWAVRGCLEWQRAGLQAPQEIKQATAAYRAEQDTIGAFILERCKVGPGCQATAGGLYVTYKDWGGDLNQRRFSQAMAERGFTTQGRDENGRALYPGVGIGVYPKDGVNP